MLKGTEKREKGREILVGKSVYDSTEPTFEGKHWPTRTAVRCETKLG
jgi:hypothetical protein